jgi:hypothetical protein
MQIKKQLISQRLISRKLKSPDQIRMHQHQPVVEIKQKELTVTVVNFLR